MIQVHTCKLYPTPDQLEELEYRLYVSRRFYNYCLEQRIMAWECDKARVGEYDQNNEVTLLRKVMPSLKHCPSRILYDVTRRLDQAFQAFFRRVKAGETPGFPKFKSWKQWNTIRFTIESRFLFGTRVKFARMSPIKTRGLNRDIVGELKFACVKRQPDGWFCHIMVEDGQQKPSKVPVESSVGIDVGLMKFAVLSDGTEIENPRFLRQFERKLERAHRALARTKKGSQKRWKAIRRLQRIYIRLTYKRSTFTHTQAKRIAELHQLIAVENLNISGMVQGRFGKSILDAAWSQFIARLVIKSENVGGEVVKVDPCGTSQECSRCGSGVPKTLAVRTHDCPTCGLVLDRDLNSARNILDRATRPLSGMRKAPGAEKAPQRKGNHKRELMKTGPH